MSGNRFSGTFLWAALGILLLWVAQPIWKTWLTPNTASVTSQQPKTITARGDLAADEQTTIGIFEHNSPSVVYITTVEKVRDLWTRNVSEVPSGTGTGFVWDKAGHIVTNNHVIAGHRTAKVRLSDQRVFDAVVVGSSEQHDIAVLRLQNTADAPPPVQIGTSHDLKVGQKVFAIGNPFGLDHTLTSGIISALGRSIDSEDNQSMEGLIQTDAAINPGNSGGPLLDSAGRVIGVNVAIYSPSGASAGIGFAIPADVVNRVVPRLIKDGRYTRPILGVSLDDSVSRKITERLNTTGALVLEVSPNTPAAAAGLRATEVTANDDIVLGDIIQAINGKPINNVGELTNALDNFPLNSTITLEILRNGKDKQTVEIKLDLMR